MKLPFLLVFAAGSVALASPLALPQLFPSRADVTVPSAGLHSLDLPVDVIKECHADLSDLRLWDGSREVPYVVDSSDAEWTLQDRADVKVDALNEDKSACAPVPKGAHCETLGLSTTARGDGWELVFENDSPRFVERVKLSIADKTIVESIYRVPGGPPERVRFPLPTIASGPIAMTLTGDGASPAVRVHLERGRRVRGGESVAAPLRVAGSWHDADGSHVLLDRPRGILPSSLRFDVAGGTFDRPVHVFDYGGTSMRRLVGTGRLSRVSLSAAGERVAIDELDVALGVPREKQLEVVVDDGDSPPLVATIRAILKRPVLLFDAEPGTLTLYFGGGRAEAPRYDLRGLLPQLGDETPDGLRAEVAARLHARDGLTAATLGARGSNPQLDTTPALASVMHAGGEIDASLYAKTRPLALTPSPDGLSRYVLAAADLAAARSDLADLRVVDAAQHQWPYLLTRDVEPVVVELGKPVRTTSGDSSRYTFALPAAPLEADELTLEIAEPFFSRSASVRVLDAAGREEPTSTRITRALGNGPTTPVTLTLPARRASSLVLEIVDGGDAPLTIVNARVVVRTAALQLTAKAGNYRLLVGNPDDAAPTYEVASLDSTIAQLDAIDARAGALVDNPTFSRSARLGSGGGRERLLVWIVLALAVVVLGGLTLRLARTPDAGPDAKA